VQRSPIARRFIDVGHITLPINLSYALITKHGCINVFRLILPNTPDGDTVTGKFERWLFISHLLLYKLYPAVAVNSVDCVIGHIQKASVILQMQPGDSIEVAACKDGLFPSWRFPINMGCIGVN